MLRCSIGDPCEDVEVEDDMSERLGEEDLDREADAMVVSSRRRWSGGARVRLRGLYEARPRVFVDEDLGRPMILGGLKRGAYALACVGGVTDASFSTES